MEHLHDSIGSNRFVVRLFILVFACNIAFEANAPHMAETFHKEAVRADAIVDFQNLIGQQQHREQFCERMLFDLLCKFHCSVRGVSLIPVSYTHLDVYKRQVNRGAPGYAVKDPAKVFGGHFCCGGEIFQGDAAGVILSDAL